MPNALQLVSNPLTIVAGAGVTAKRFVGYNGQHCGAGAKALGIAFFDALTGEAITVYGPGNVLELTAGGIVAAGNQVASDANGKGVVAAAFAAAAPAVTYDASKVTIDSAKVTIGATKLTVDTGATPVTSSAANGDIITAAADAMAVAADAVSIASGAVALAAPALSGGVLPVTVNAIALTAASGADVTFLVMVL